jgi:hypothetical protein
LNDYWRHEESIVHGITAFVEPERDLEPFIDWPHLRRSDRWVQIAGIESTKRI